MDLKASNSKYFESQPSFHSHQQETRVLEGNAMFFRTRAENPFLDAFQDPLCKLNLKETSEFVRSFPSSENSTNLLDVQRRREVRRTTEAPPTPGRPIFSFSVGNLPRKGPSKWDDAEKWLIGGHDSPAHHHHHHHHSFRPPPPPPPPPQPSVEFCPNSRFSDTRVISTTGFSEDKFTNENTDFPAFKCSEPSKQGFLFSNAAEEAKPAITDANEEVKHRDIGTEMTPLGSSTTSRCPTPFKSTSPARHNTPDNRSGPLVISNSTTTIDITQIQFDQVTSNWSSREEEEEEISKSLRHFDLTNHTNSNNGEVKKDISESRTFASWEEEEKTKCCLRYQREEAKIQAWVNLQRAKAEAQSRKLEVKIEKMRSNLEDKLMKKMGIVHRKAEEWRTTSRIQHLEQMQRGKSEKMMINNGSSSKKICHYLGKSSSKSHCCGCFPCTNGTAAAANQYPY